MTDLTQRQLREMLDYDPATGEFWSKVNRPNRGVGDVAGWTTKNGYRQICVVGKKFYSHRLAFLWMTGDLPSDQVDHVNGDRSDNRWANLRLASNQQNGANSKKKTARKGPKGVYWDKRFNKYVAQIMVNYRRKFLGHFDTPEKAHDAYLTAAKKHFGEYARAD